MMTVSRIIHSKVPRKDLWYPSYRIFPWSRAIFCFLGSEFPLFLCYYCCFMKLLQCRVGLILATMNPHNPQSSIPAEADIIFQSFKATKPAYIWASPRFIEVRYQRYLKFGRSTHCYSFCRHGQLIQRKFDF